MRRTTGRAKTARRALAAALAVVVSALAGLRAEAEEPAWAGGLVVLVYHEVLPDRVRPWLPMQVRRSQFAAEMAALGRWGYRAISLGEAAAQLTGRRPLRPHEVLITFDDGYASVYARAFPILRRQRLPAVVFLIVGRVGRPGYLTWAEIRRMQASGLIAFASHTFALHSQGWGRPDEPWPHELGLWLAVWQQGEVAAPQVLLAPRRGGGTRASLARIEGDLRRSREVLARALGQAPDALAWPYGAYDALAVRAAVRAGFRLLFTTAHGLDYPGDALAVRRVTVWPGISLTAFRTLLRTGR